MAQLTWRVLELIALISVATLTFGQQNGKDEIANCWDKWSNCSELREYCGGPLMTSMCPVTCGNCEPNMAPTIALPSVTPTPGTDDPLLPPPVVEPIGQTATPSPTTSDLFPPPVLTVDPFDKDGNERVSNTAGDDNCLTREIPLKKREYAAFQRSQSKFAWQLYSRIPHLDNAENTYVFSPTSISMALGMMYQAARGQTKDNIVKLVAAAEELPTSQISSAYLALQQDLRKHDDYDFSLANAIYLDKRIALNEQYKKEIDRCYDGVVTTRDFDQKTKVKNEINRWIAKRTNNLIRNFLNADQIIRRAVVLVNALYFKGEWETPFMDGKNFAGVFNGETTATVMPFLRKTIPAAYYQNNEIQLLGLPYKNRGLLSMYFLLPKLKNTASMWERKNVLRNFEKRLATNATWTNKLFESYLTKMDTSLVDVTIPKLTLASPTYQLRQLLTDESGRDAGIFGDSTDYTRMTDDVNMRFGGGLHKTVIQVNEKGTEAAAVTTATLERKNTLQPHWHFTADRPFLFFIRHRDTGALLFMGRVGDKPK